MPEKQFIISIGREFGTAGYDIAVELAKRFDVKLYDFHLLREIADEKQVGLEALEKYDEIPKKGFGSRTVRGYSNSIPENIAYLQFNHLKKRAAEGRSFVVVGRCAEEALKEFDCLIPIFILGDMDKKIEYVCNRFGVPREGCEKFIRETDKKRKAYHNYFCEGKWGDSRNYELCINSSKLGIEATTDFIENYARQRIASFK